MAIQYLVYQHSNRKYIALQRVPTIDKSLRRHIQWGAYIIILFLFHQLKFFCEAKISDFGNTVSEENIRWFEISVDYTMLCQVFVPRKDVLDDSSGPGLTHGLGLLMLFEEGHEIASLAVLGDDIAVITGDKNIIAPDNVWVVELLENTHLGLEHLPVGGCVLPQVDHLDGE